MPSASWAKNAYESGWGYKDGSYGNRDDSDRIRCADNAGLMLGYLNYNAEEKSFGNDFQTLTYTEQGDINTMPEVAGIGLFDGEKHGIYIRKHTKRNKNLLKFSRNIKKKNRADLIHPKISRLLKKK